MIHRSKLQKARVPLPWEAEIPKSRDATIEQNVWRWKGYEYPGSVAHLVWEVDEFTIRAICGHEYTFSEAPAYFAELCVSHCKRCQRIYDKAHETRR